MYKDGIKNTSPLYNECTINNEKKDRSHEWTVRPPKKLMKYVAEKGSISINGVSLTVNFVQENSFKINLIQRYNY